MLDALAALIAASQSDMGIVVISIGRPIGVLWRCVRL